MGRRHGLLCHMCISRLRLKRRVLAVVLNNLKGYESHLNGEQAIGEMPGRHLKVIPTNHKKYIYIYISARQHWSSKTKKATARYFEMACVDSFQHLSSYLTTLAMLLDLLPITKQCSSACELDFLASLMLYFLTKVSFLSHILIPPFIEALMDKLFGAECSPEEYVCTCSRGTVWTISLEF